MVRADLQASARGRVPAEAEEVPGAHALPAPSPQSLLAYSAADVAGSCSTCPSSLELQQALRRQLSHPSASQVRCCSHEVFCRRSASQASMCRAQLTLRLTLRHVGDNAERAGDHRGAARSCWAAPREDIWPAAHWSAALAELSGLNALLILAVMQGLMDSCSCYTAQSRRRQPLLLCRRASSPAWRICLPQVCCFAVLQPSQVVQQQLPGCEPRRRYGR